MTPVGISFGLLIALFIALFAILLLYKMRKPQPRTGPPKYVSRTWPGEIAEGDTSRGQWNETVKRFLTAA